MTEPFFSIVVPTKNRPDRVGDAVRSVIEQSWADLEVVVCDNSDGGLDEETARVTDSFGDARIRYVRTSGTLSMPDNWEHGIAQASGAYVGVLTDRSVFKPDSLAKVQRAIDDTGARAVNWFNDLYGRDATKTQYKRRPSTLRPYRLTSSEVLDYFVHGHPKWATKIIPKLMTSVYHRSILDELRASPAGRCCPPVAPDFTSGFLTLAHCDWVLTLDDALYVSVGTGNGAAFRRRGELADRFRADLGMTWHDMVDRMPTEACFAHALVLNDLMRVKDMVPDRLGSIEIDRAQYYLGCLNDYAKTSRHGVNRDEDLEALLAGLEREAPDVQYQVRSRRLYANVVMPKPTKKRSQAETSASRAVPDAPDRFESVWDAIAWDTENPRHPIPEGFLDSRPGLEAIGEVSAKHLEKVMQHRVAPLGVAREPKRAPLHARLLGLLGRG